MSYRKAKIYNTPLNTIKKVQLPSNLLSFRTTIRQYETIRHRIPNTIDIVSQQHPNSSQKRQQDIIIQERPSQSPKNNVFHKRLNQIKEKNQSLQAYSYSKLLSKMIFNQTIKASQDEIQFNPFPVIRDHKIIKGKTFDLQINQPTKTAYRTQRHNDKKDKEYMNKTTRIFQKFYNPKGQRMNRYLMDRSIDEQEKYVYINGVKSECKRIHNFYTSHHYRNRNDKSMNNTKVSFYSRKNQF